MYIFINIDKLFFSKIKPAETTEKCNLSQIVAIKQIK